MNKAIGGPQSTRILGELKSIISHISPYITVYVKYQRTGTIRAFFFGPPGSPSANRFWSVYITFPKVYPSRPPMLRFTNVPHHLDLSPEGGVLFTIIESEYRVATTLSRSSTVYGPSWVLLS
jgi:ubiquitin-protein ligase